MGQQLGLLFARANRMSLNFSLWNLTDRHTNDGKKDYICPRFILQKVYTVWYHIIQKLEFIEDFWTGLSTEIAVCDKDTWVCRVSASSGPEPAISVSVPGLASGAQPLSHQFLFSLILV